MTQPNLIRLGTRGSALARWQTSHVSDLLCAVYNDLTVEVEVISTKGDRVLDKPLPLVGGKGVFTAELEAALHEERIDGAVHSLKDLPTEAPSGLTVGGIPKRAHHGDVLVSRGGHTLSTLPRGATIGTSSTRRAAQLRHYRSDFEIIDIRGNVDTRLSKALAPDGAYDAIVLAHAGLERMERLDTITEVIPHGVMLPAPGQGALGVQCRDDVKWRGRIGVLDHPETRAAVTAERAFLAGLGGGCSMPIAAFGYTQNRTLHLVGRVIAPDGTTQVEVRDDAPVPDDMIVLYAVADQLGRRLAQEALSQGAQRILEAISYD